MNGDASRRGEERGPIFGAEAASSERLFRRRPEPRFRVRDYAVLLKPRVMSLVVFTGMVGMVVAPSSPDFATAAIAVVCIAVGAGASGAINMWYDRDIDGEMTRTRNRPLPAGRLQPRAALAYGSVLAALSVGTMAVAVNGVAAALLAATIAYYVFVYTMWLKRRTPHNIVIGGASGALPPVIGWAAASGEIGLGSLVLFAIIFLWTPPHSWALALFRKVDYDRARVPMLPVVAGDRETRRQILLYTLVLVPVTLIPVAIGLGGWVYGIAAAVLGSGMLWHALRVWRSDGTAAARSLFFFSILYLFAIFLALLVDRGLHAAILPQA
jgi:protoheme IX farnesyltransferase